MAIFGRVLISVLHTQELYQGAGGLMVLGHHDGSVVFHTPATVASDFNSPGHHADNKLLKHFHMSTIFEDPLLSTIFSVLVLSIVMAQLGLHWFTVK